MDRNLFVRKTESIVMRVLEKTGLLVNEWQLGTVESVNVDGTLNVYVNGGNNATPNIPSNPDVTFSSGDSVWVHYVNRNSYNLFIPYKR